MRYSTVYCSRVAFMKVNDWEKKIHVIRSDFLDGNVSKLQQKHAVQEQRNNKK